MSADKPSKKDLKAIHKQALARADEAYVFERENIREGRDDQKFYAGDQWDEAAKKARGTERPMLTVNRMGTFVRQVTGDLRQNTPANKLLPAHGAASQDKADVLSGMIRSIEAASDASACYVKAASNAAQAGQGAFRVATKYVSDTSFDQVIVILQIPDPFGVLIDPLAQLPDKSDMAYGFVFDRLSKEAFKAEYPDATTEDFPIEVINNTSGMQWLTGDSIRRAEYWCREKGPKRTIYLLESGEVVDKVPRGAKIKSSREVAEEKIVSYMMSGKEILSGPHAWDGKYIPICFVPGEEVTIDGATRRKGMIRDAKDPQRLLNYARTTDAESTALQPKAPFVGTKDQIKGYEAQWNTAGTKNHPILLYNFNPAMGPNQAPQRSQPPAMSSGLQNLSAQAGQDLHDVFGIYPASLGAKSNETSGVAIRARQHEGDTGSNYIPDNTKRAIAYCGRILVDLIPKIYDSQRIVRILKEDGSHEMETINGPRVDKKTGRPLPELDLSEGEYDVIPSTGPSYLTRQQEKADMMIEAGKAIPQIGQVAPDLFVKALDFPGGDEIAKRLERSLPPNITSDKPLPPPPPNPMEVAKVEETIANAKLKTAQAEKAEVEATTGTLAILQTMQQMQATMRQMQQQLTSGLPQVGPGGQPQVPAPMLAPPAIPTPPMQPLAEQGAAMGELEPMPQ